MEPHVAAIASIFVLYTIVTVIKNAKRVHKKFEVRDFVRFDDLKHFEPQPNSVQEMMKNI
jgi:hypothetical protein